MNLLQIGLVILLYISVFLAMAKQTAIPPLREKAVITTELQGAKIVGVTTHMIFVPVGGKGILLLQPMAIIRSTEQDTKKVVVEHDHQGHPYITWKGVRVYLDHQ